MRDERDLVSGEAYAHLRDFIVYALELTPDDHKKLDEKMSQSNDVKSVLKKRIKKGKSLYSLNFPRLANLKKKCLKEIKIEIQQYRNRFVLKLLRNLI